MCSVLGANGTYEYTRYFVHAVNYLNSAPLFVFFLFFSLSLSFLAAAPPVIPEQESDNGARTIGCVSTEAQ